MRRLSREYSLPSGALAVKVKGGGGWNAYDTARLQISVGQKYHEGDKLFATLEWAKHRFEKVIICVNDTLQRYNYQFEEGLSQEQAFNKAEAEGREWVERNIGMIRNLPRHTVYRWEEWRNRTDYKTEFELVHELYAGDATVRTLVNQNVDEFWERRQKKGAVDVSRYEEFSQLSRDYLLEETAAFFLMFKQDKAADVYPGSVLLPCVLAHGDGSVLGARGFTRITFTDNIHKRATVVGA